LRRAETALPSVGWGRESPSRCVPISPPVERAAASETEHAAVLGEILASAADQELAPEQVETQVLAAAARWRHADDQRALQSLLRQPLEALTADERDALTRGLIATARGVRRDGDAPS